MRHQSLVILFFLGLPFLSEGQSDFYSNYPFTASDTLRGMLRPERTCYDVTFYDLNIKVDVAQQRLSGMVSIYYTVRSDFERLQLDLFENLQIDKIESADQSLSWERKHNAVFVRFPEIQKTDKAGVICVYYQGKPQVAAKPPWDGGFIWTADQQRRPWVGVACQGTGASLWWPNKDHLSDEPDSMSIRVAVPRGLSCISNGRMRAKVPQEDGYDRFEWFVSYPINNYNVSINIGHYAHFSEVYDSPVAGDLTLNYYVLDYQEQIARKHFKQVNGVLEAFEHYFGPYPFWRDGYALIETPYLGMEHQSGIAYGNRFMRGYLGWGIPKNMNWDYIIVHETGHEYFGNSLSCRDNAELWLHESFTTYMESLFVEYSMSKEDAIYYLNTQRDNIVNSQPIVGPFGVNWDNWDASDHYYKGAWILHTLRAVIDDDVLWFDILKSFYLNHSYGFAETQDFWQLVAEKTGRSFEAVAQQYLYYPTIPVLEYKVEEKGKHLVLSYRWKAAVEAFDMPVWFYTERGKQIIFPEKNWQEIKLKNGGKLDFSPTKKHFLIELQPIR
ncbi:MAG TPA: M1 family metallopeptidase [Saprospiraceae bacterium]|nr:M1 family metallopeptidase [Saprospiraceae bacterium]